MPGSTFGELFRVTNFGESHGPAIGCVIDGCPPGLALAVEDIQPELDRRRPGTSRHVTQRNEADAVEILSGWMSSTDSASPGGQPSITQPIAGLWLSPKLVTRNNSPKVLPGMGAHPERQDRKSVV